MGGLYLVVSVFVQEKQIKWQCEENKPKELIKIIPAAEFISIMND